MMIKVLWAAKVDKKILSTNSAMVAFVFDSLWAQETVEKLIGCLLVSDDSTFIKFLLLKIFGLVGDE